jgi:hypothetical protein
MTLKRSVLYLSAIGLILGPVSLARGHAQKWAGSVETKDGVKTIINPVQPLFGEVRFDLEDVWTLGKEKSENDLFASIYDIQVDAHGNVYVSDIKDRRVKQFSAEGNYLRDIGRMGQGPGEYQGARNVAVEDSSGDVYLADLLKVHRYNRDGLFQNDIPLQGYFGAFFVDRDGQFWARMMSSGETGPRDYFSKISRQGEIVKIIAEFTAQDFKTSKSGDGTAIAVRVVKHGYENEAMISVIDARAFLWAMSQDYVLNVVDSQGNLSYKIQKQEPVEPFSNKEKDKILSQFNPRVREKMELPKYKPFLKKVFADNEGRIYVQRVRSPLDDKGEYLCDVFSKEGHCLYRARFAVEPTIIKNGFLYSVVREQDTSYQLVKKYRIKNWNQIEKEIPR